MNIEVPASSKMSQNYRPWVRQNGQAEWSASSMTLSVQSVTSSQDVETVRSDTSVLETGATSSKL